ncbi:OmpA family protein [Sediminicoccus rosea]|jgi:outer membrane protein OmpA-like peptidoglycan-associated protein|uniref:OmpA family protein n=1 Tax=Sediminicoccus rosea TaxID=1225128 RepID=A0ABZ0PLA3_9PROT|nr:OmpA family protein [Sediminicoccus rosea]WPB86519.1 OmpA family protein [Sediminicoccus rosea]
MSRSILAGALGVTILFSLAAWAQERRPGSPAPGEVRPAAASRVAASVRFAPGSSSLDEAGQASLAPILARLLAEPRSVATIITHAAGMDFSVARARAMAVRRALTGRGIPGRRIRIVNAGMSRGAEPGVVLVRVR